LLAGHAGDPGDVIGIASGGNIRAAEIQLTPQDLEELAAVSR
jgi:hypothetical protein